MISWRIPFSFRKNVRFAAIPRLNNLRMTHANCRLLLNCDIICTIYELHIDNILFILMHKVQILLHPKSRSKIAHCLVAHHVHSHSLLFHDFYCLFAWFNDDTSLKLKLTFVICSCDSNLTCSSFRLFELVHNHFDAASVRTHIAYDLKGKVSSKHMRVWNYSDEKGTIPILLFDFSLSVRLFPSILWKHI